MEPTTKTKILLALPTHDGRIEVATTAVAYTQSVDPTQLDPPTVHVVTKAASLLSFNFNTLWCCALNNRDNYTHFAMLHSDIVPEKGWIDTLLAEMDSSGADIIGVASPIKDGRGLTSCGIGYHDEWRVPKKRFTLTELQDLPPTFTADQVGHPGEPMLINTGCWMADMRKPQWWNTDTDNRLRIYFTIRDGILIEDGQYAPRVESEDWWFSKRLWSEGLTAACTTAVSLTHTGRFDFSNQVRYGLKHDTVEVPA